MAERYSPEPLSGRQPRDGYLLVPTARNGHGVTLAISGEIDISNAEAFTDEVKLLFNGANGEMTLDLQHCVFIDSAGIRALVVLAQEQQARGERSSFQALPVSPSGC